MVETGPRRDEDEGELRRMSRPQFWGVLALALAMFLFETGPIWRHPWDMSRLNQAIFWSYVAIPLLVIGCLAWSRRLSLRALFLDVLELTLLKYVCTFAFALVLWEVTPAPARPAAAPPHHQPVESEPAIAPTKIDPASTGVVEGTVVGADGRPAAGAVVFVSAGLEGYVFAPPAEPLELANGGAGMVPRAAVARVGQRLAARSADGRLHTLVASRGGETLFNMPLLSSGEPSHTKVRDGEGVVTIRCNAHRGSDEIEGHLLVLAHPFFARSDEGGRFRLNGVPAGRLQVAVWRDGLKTAGEPIDLAAGGSGAVRLVAP